MTDPGFAANFAGWVAIIIMVIAIPMALWWKKRNFRGSLSKGIGKSPFRRKQYDFDSDTKIDPPK